MLPTVTETSLEPHRFGEFWVYDPKVKSYKISRLLTDNVIRDLGFRLYQGDIYQIIGITLIKRTVRELQDTLKFYIEQDQEDYEKIYNTYSAFMQRNTKFIVDSLQIIQRDEILNDTPTSCYKFFTNGYLQITPIEIFFKEYKEFPKNKFVFSHKISPREYRIAPEGKYSEFLKLATNWSAYSENIMSVIGYLCHEYKDETTGYIIVLTEQCPDPKDGGGSGKNLFCNLLSHSTSYHSKNGAQIKFDEKFFQSWNGQRIMGISDVPKNFPFEFLKEPSTGTFILKKLFKDEVEIPVQDGPKFVIQTNYSYEISDGGLRRRIIPVEFTDFFTKAGGIDQHFGCHFPTGWTPEDWANYDTVIAGSIQQWLSSGRKLHSVELTETGKEKQFEYSYGKNLAEFIRDNFQSWIEYEEVEANVIRGALKSFLDDNDVPKLYRPNSQKVASAIKEYSASQGYVCKPNVAVREALLTKKCYFFVKKQY